MQKKKWNSASLCNILQVFIFECFYDENLLHYFQTFCSSVVNNSTLECRRFLSLNINFWEEPYSETGTILLSLCLDDEHFIYSKFIVDLHKEVLWQTQHNEMNEMIHNLARLFFVKALMNELNCYFNVVQWFSVYCVDTGDNQYW